MKLSIGVAVYNVREDYLRASIESLFGQLTDEVELLLLDDCSTDNSGEVCKEYAKKSEFVRYIRLEQNGGLSVVRNRTIAEAAGKWIFFADGDDMFPDTFVKTALSLSHEDYDIIIHEREIFSGEQRSDRSDREVPKLIALPEGAGREISLSCLCLKPLNIPNCPLSEDAYYHVAWGALYRKEFLTENRLEFPVGQKKAQDSVFNTVAYFKAKRIAYLPYVMYDYRKDMQGITQRYSADFTNMALSLVGHHINCMETLYPGDEEVRSWYQKKRAISLVLDSMRLNLFHPDNPNTKGARKKEFLEFVRTEPFKSAIETFPLKSCDWWGWRVPIALAKKKRFGMLDFFFRHPMALRLYGGLGSRLRRSTK